MLYPREDKTDPDKNSLVFACGMCDHYETAEEQNYCVWQHELSNTVGETAGITQDVAADPSVGAHQPSSLPRVSTSTSTFSSKTNDNECNEYGSNEKENGPGGTQQSLSQSMLREPADYPLCCTMCGEEITCEICGQPTENGIWLEINANNNDSDVFTSNVSNLENADEPLYSPGLQISGLGKQGDGPGQDMDTAAGGGGVLGRMKA